MKWPLLARRTITAELHGVRLANLLPRFGLTFPSVTEFSTDTGSFRAVQCKSPQQPWHLRTMRPDRTTASGSRRGLHHPHRIKRTHDHTLHTHRAAALIVQHRALAAPAIRPIGLQPQHLGFARGHAAAATGAALGVDLRQGLGTRHRGPGTCAH